MRSFTVFDLLVQTEAWVPLIWQLEAANVLEVGVRRGRRSPAFRDAVLLRLSILPIWFDPHTNQYSWNTTLQLATRHGLTLYDATYLELAMRLGLPLATLDRELRAAAPLEKVPLLGT